MPPKLKNEDSSNSEDFSESEEILMDEDDDDDEEDESAVQSDSEWLNVNDTIEVETVSMEYCSKNLYQGSLANIKDMCNGAEYKREDDPPEVNNCVFKNVDPKWGWKEEVLLLEKIQVNGFFNWKTIASHLTSSSKKRFCAKEVRDHYFQYYYNGTLGQLWNYQLEEGGLQCFDHTDPVTPSATYLPSVSTSNLKEIKFLPHRGDFEEYGPNEFEFMLSRVDFSSYYLSNLKASKIDEEVKKLQLLVVDAYRDVVAERCKMHKFIKNYKLIEQYFNMRNGITRKCELESYFSTLQKFICFFDSPNEFIKFYYDCVREQLLKLEISRLYEALETKKKMSERDPRLLSMLKRRAPDCFSMLTKILYSTGQKRGRKNLNSLKEKEQNNVLLHAHPTLLAGMLLHLLKDGKSCTSQNFEVDADHVTIQEEN